MVNFVYPKLVIRNISKRDINVLNSIRLKRGQEENLFSYAPHLSESTVIDALRAPNGELYIESEIRKSIKIIECSLVSDTAFTVDESKLDVASHGKAGQVLSINEEGQFEWVFRGDVGRLNAQPPLVKNGDDLSLPQANALTNGYLSKEDWLLFKGKSKGIRVWQYQDFPDGVSDVVKLTRFENGIGNIFNSNYIINSSAVIVSSRDVESPPKADGGFWEAITGSKKVYVTQHDKDSVVLNAIPKESEPCRVYFLVILPENVDLPKGHEQPPRYVRNERIELIDAIDIDTGGSKSIKGDKTFDDKVSAKSGLSVEGGLTVANGLVADNLQVTKNASHNYSLLSNGMGEAKWSPNPIVSSLPPANQYDGQLWVKSPEFELFVHDASRNKWRSTDSFDTYGALNTTSASKCYMHMVDNIPSNVNSIVLDYDAVLVGLMATSETKSSWVAEVHVNHSLVKDAVLPVVNSDRACSSTLNVDFKAGDKIQLFMNGEGVSMPCIKAIFRKRV